MRPAPESSRSVPPVAAVYSVSAAASFIDSVAAGLIAQTRADPAALSDHLVLVPDRETAVALRRACVSQLGTGISLLPQIEALDSLDPESVSLQVAGNPRLVKKLLDIAPAVSVQERQMVLARAIMNSQSLQASLPTAMKLAQELGHFIDEAIAHDVDLTRLDALADARFETQWGKTRDLLHIVTHEWPAYLKETGRMDTAKRRRVMLETLAAHWQAQPLARPVTAVGFRPSTPATLAVLAAVTAAPQGRIVVQGFDTAIDEDSWQQMSPTHPDYPVRHVLNAIGQGKDDVQPWPVEIERTALARAVNPVQAQQARARLLRETMRPAATAEGWGNLKLDVQAFNGMDLVTAGSPQEEASVIALKLRETLEVQGRTAAFVTADRALARRVAARLKHWQIDIADSAGASLAETSLGLYLHATAHMAAEEWAPVPFLQAMKHPLAALGRDGQVYKEQLAALEDMALHGPRPAPGARGLRRSLTANFNDVASRRSKPDPKADAELRSLKKLISDIVRAGDVYFKLMARKRPQPFADLLDAHLRYCEALATAPDVDGAARMWQGQAGAQAAKFFTALRQHAHLMPAMTGRDYTAVVSAMMRDVRVSPERGASHPQLAILTPEQALRSRADVLIVGGLTADSWPPRARNNPWLTPHMIRALGLPDGSAGVSDAAHAFAQVLSSPNVLLTRALRSGDAPTVPSPLLTRLLMVARAAGLRDALVGKSQLLDIHTAIHTPAEVMPVEPPAPTPEAKLRPKQLPVTAVEKLMRDPYSVYARYVLRLRPKAPIDAAPGVADRGISTHAALDIFLRRYPDALPDQPYEELLKIGRETFAAHLDNPTVQSFWWPRFERVAAWFVRFEQERREMTRNLGTEVRGKLEIDLGDSIFTLTTIADRLDMTHSDQIDIIDYKTGSVPTQKSVALGFSPQLTLEALIAFTGGFEGIDAGDVGALQYWKLSGGRPAADVTQVKAEVRQLVNEAREGITNLMRAFADAKTPYVTAPRPEWAPRYNDYTHLSREAEWSTVKQVGAAKPAVNRKTTKTPANQNRRAGKTPAGKSRGGSGSGRRRS